MNPTHSTFHKRILSSVVASLMASGVGAPVLAQQATNGPIEEVVVRGIKSSLEQSIDLKRESTQMMEAITADDIGEMPDQNVAESLQRLPGVQIDRRGGEGTKVRIRGLDQNITLLNGENFVSGMEYYQLGEWRQNYDGSLEGIPSELLGGVEVYKTPVASMVEGGMGGVINLKTRSALDLSAPLFAANIKADQGLDAEDVKPSAFIVAGNNWGDFGAIASLTINQKTVHNDMIQNFSRENTGVLCTEGGEFDTDSLTCSDGRSYLAPGMFYVMDTEQERERLGASVNLSWQATDALEFGFDWFHSTLDIETRSYTVKHPMATDDATGVNEEFDYGINSANEVGILTYGTVDVPGGETNTAGEVMEGDADNLAFRADFDNGGAFRASSALTYAEASHERRAGMVDSRFTPYTFRGYVGTDESPNGWGDVVPNPRDSETRYEYRAGSKPSLAYTDPSILTNPDYHTYKSHWALGSDVEQETYSVRFDTEYDIELGDLKTLSFGVRRAEEEVDFRELRWMTDFSRTEGAMTPNIYDEDGNIVTPTNFDPETQPGPLNDGVREAVYYDLCGNGGIPAKQTCDIDGDGLDDNRPFGPWGYFIDAAIGLKAFELETSNGTNMAEALYGPDIMLGGAGRWSGSPGYLPWESFTDNPDRYVELNNFFPSGGYQSNVLMHDAAPIVNDVEGWIDGVAPNTPGRWFEVPLNSWVVTETSTALYGEADFSGDRVPYTLNVGVRVVNTEVDIQLATRDPQAVAENWTQATDGWNSQGVLLVWNNETVTEEYWDILPSLNFVLDTTDATKLRFSAAKVIARPNLQDLGRGQQYNYTRTNEPGFGDYFQFTGGSSGNPSLDPYRATQADVAFEWYFDDLGLLSAGAFTKAVESFIASETRLEFGADDGPDGGSWGGVNRPQNGSGGSVSGIELAFQQSFENGFGMSANYTFSDSKTDTDSTLNSNLGLPGVSEHAFNVMGFYENEYLSTRLAYTWRDEYLSPHRSVFDVGGLQNGASEFYDAYGQWDANLTWDINDNFSLTAEAINITGEEQTSYLGYSSHPMTYTSQEPRLVLGVSFRM
ncbi:TonB-dependent receptor domain-containing protein [Marinimicrobium agarilyticum]|uniref:TonB-dependent receptor domain-containing protein n=1 Tax=Marinimicrobium agarilyticum TaxID=306546 RepID=UPI0009FC8C27|nr:TonB-dependent receptor [Marinimicrobium agarilyticum]